MPEHPKVEPLSDAAFRWIFRGLSYANRYLTNGVLPPVFLAKVPEPILAEMLAVQEGQKSSVWKRGADGKVRIHDYRDYQPSKSDVEKVRRGNRNRQQQFRDRVREASERAARESQGETSRDRNGVTNDTPSRPVPSRSRRTNSSPHPPSKEGGGVRQPQGSRKPRLSTRKPSATEQKFAENYLKSVGRCPHHETPCRSDSVCVGRLVMERRQRLLDGMLAQAEGEI